MSKNKEEKDCRHCNAECCKHIAIEIDKPKKLKDFEELKWFVAHENVNVFVEEDGSWNVEFITPCMHLGKDNLCAIYEKRPEVCREYGHDECVFHNTYEEKHTFKTIEDIEEYIKKEFKPSGKKSHANKNKS